MASKLYEIKLAYKDGAPTILLKCPGCKVFKKLTIDQYNGKEQFDCDCGYYINANFTKQPIGA